MHIWEMDISENCLLPVQELNIGLKVVTHGY